MPEYDCINQRIIKMEDKLETHKDTLDRHDRRLTDLATSLHENTALTKQIADNTGEMVELFKDAKTFARWTMVIRKFILWVTSLAVGVFLFFQTFWGVK